MCNVGVRRVRVTIVAVENESITFSQRERERVRVPLGTQHAKPVTHIVVRGLSVCTLFCYIFSYKARLGGGGV
jgi:hypothetical protein